MQADKVADGVWYLTGGTHHSVLVEMNDHLVVIEGPQDDARALAVIAGGEKARPEQADQIRRQHPSSTSTIPAGSPRLPRTAR